jgi:beta-glucosidase
MLGHGLAVDAMRAARPDLRYGITLNLYPVDPATDDPADAEAARQVDGITNRIFLDPILRGEYAADVLRDLAPVAGTAHIEDGDEKQIGVPLDVLGVNYYSRHVVRAGTPEPGPSEWVGVTNAVKIGTGRPTTEMGWEIDETGLYDILTRITREYRTPPLYVTENGAAFDDVVSADGAVHDQQRIAFLDGHFRAAARAVADGVDLRGYFVWSLMDNFEWAWGFSRRFGLIYVDYPTQRRIVKDSGRWLAGVVSG